MKLIAYVRRSTDLQEDSLETQERLIRDHCERLGHTLVGVCMESSMTAGTPIDRRPVASDLFNKVRDKNRGFDGIIVLRMDRMFRDPQEEYPGLAYLGKYNCEVVSITDPIDRSTPHGELLYGIMMHVRQFERQLTGQRIKEHNLALALSGRWPAGQPPLGFDYDSQSKELSVNSRADEVVRVYQVFQECSGNASRTARTLNMHGSTSRDDNPWRDDSVLAIVKNPIYRRRLRYDGREIDAPDLIPQIVPDDLLESTDHMLAKKKSFTTRQHAQKYLYSRILTCSECGSRMKFNGSNGWVCSLKKDSGLCNSRNVANKYIDKMVGDAVQIALAEIREDMSKDIAGDVPEKKDNSKSQIKRLEEAKKRIWEAYIEGHITTQKERDKRIQDIDDKIQEIRQPQQPEILSQPEIYEWLSSISNYWSEISDDDKREMIDIIDARIRVCSKRHVILWIEFSSLLTQQPVRVSMKDKNK